MAKAVIKLKVRYCETGGTGFVHHANYYNWFDLALEALFESLGAPYAQYEKMGLRTLPVSNGCRYSLPVRYGDELLVSVETQEATGVKMRFSYHVAREGDGAAVATGYSENILVGENMRPVNIRRVFPELYEKLAGQGE